tara:strand:+ start:2461 stop:3117 length:657 start_codon:yes stop_codon:yes gene_type:complete
LENTIELKSLEKKINYTFRDKNLGRYALTHPSINNSKIKNQYQRLEFLGDSVLNFIVSKYLIECFPEINEGELTIRRANIINRKSLSMCAESIKLNNFLIKGLSVNKITEKMLCDTYEAIVGAIVLDSNIKIATIFVENTLLKKICEFQTQTNFKGKLIEFCIKKNISTPKYITRQKDNFFRTKVVFLQKDRKPIYADGYTKKEAENKVSEKLLLILK